MKESEKQQQDGLLSPEAKTTLTKATPEQDAYRKLCAILLSMTLILFTINIIQVCTLFDFTHPSRYPEYFIGLPAIVFGLFLLGISWHIWENPQAFLPIGKRKPGTWERGPIIPMPWTIRVARFGVIATAILNIVVVEFLYLNLSAIPDYEQIVWATANPALTEFRLPSVAIVERSALSNIYARLETNATTLQQLCDARNEDNQRCVGNPGVINPGHRSKYYAYFNGSDFRRLQITDSVDIYYAYTYDGNATLDVPNFEVSIFDSTLSKEDFEQGYKCGTFPKTAVLARQRNAFSLTQYSIDDELNKMNRTDACNTPSLRSYLSYNVVLATLGEDSRMNCDVASADYAGAVCYGHVSISFTTSLTTKYTSKHGTTLQKIFAEEGGFVGYVTIFTWFFDIFAK